MTWEVRLLLWIQRRLRSPFRDRFWTVVTALGYGDTLALAVCALLLCFPAYRSAAWTALLAMGAVELVFNHLLKAVAGRERPFQAHPEIHAVGRLPRDKSFPSGHTSGAFTCAGVFLWRLPPSMGVPALALACMIAFSRLYLGVHYPTDVLGGIAAAALTVGAVRAGLR